MEIEAKKVDRFGETRMRQLVLIAATAAVGLGTSGAAWAAAGAAYPNVDVRAITAPGDVTQRQLDAQGTPAQNQAPTGVLQYILPQLYAPAEAAPVAEAGGAPGTASAPGEEAPRRSGNPFTRYFLPGLQGNPAGDAPVGGMQR